MKIAIEAQQVAGKNKKTGFGVYVDSLLREFSRSAPQDFEFYLLHTMPCWNGADYGPQFHPVSYRFGRLHSAAILFRLNRVLKELRPDVFHATCTNGIPPNCCCPSIVTVHDLFPLTEPGTSLIQKTFFLILLSFTLKNADRFLCNSHFTQTELMKFNVPQEKTSVTLLAAQTAYTPDMRIRAEKPFFLCVGALERRKGQLILARAYKKASAVDPELPELYFTGPDRGDGAAMKQILQTCPKIHWLEYVPQKELIEKYLSASCLFVPSLQEGFGLPLIEAMQAGTPVICSDIPVFHEIGGDAAVYVKPSEEDFCKAILDFPRRTPVAPAALHRQASGFSWSKTAEQTLREYRLVSGKGY